MASELKEVNKMYFSKIRYNFGLDISVFTDVSDCIMIEVTDNPKPKEVVHIPFCELDWLIHCLQQAKINMQKMDKSE